MTEVTRILASGADMATIGILVYLIKLDRRILILEEWRKSITAKLAKVG